MDNELAYALVCETNKNYLSGEELAYPILLMGLGIYRIESKPDAGHNYQIVIDAVHSFFKKNPDSKADVGFENGIREIINSVGDTVTVMAAFNCICYEAKKQKNGENSFTIDCEELLATLRKKINANYDEIKNNFPELDTWLDNANQKVKQLYGLDF